MQLNEVVLKQLRSRRPFSCGVLVDKQAYDAKHSRYERVRLQGLKDLGATIYLCKGFSGVQEFGPHALPCIFHIKALVLDGRVAYYGSANLTRSSRKNKELVTRVVGAPAIEIYRGLVTEMAAQTAVRL